MIYITGDTHGDQLRFTQGNMPGESEWTKDDFLIVCGDFGFIFTGSPMENQFLDYLESKPYTICFCDGNHENFPGIYEYPELSWHGGRVHKIRDNIFHLMRGYVFTIDNKTFFAMGGAHSIDRHMRREGHSWWKEELPTNEEYREATKNLKKCNMQVDYVITHTAPREIIRRMGKYPDRHDMELTGFLEWIMYEVRFKKWFFGHWHYDRYVGEDFRAVMFDIIQINESGEINDYRCLEHG